MIAVTYISIDRLEPSFAQPRQYFDDDGIKSLSGSIEKYGILQPLIVRKKSDGDFEIIAGERRFRAAKMAHCDRLPCLIMGLSDEETLAVALVENLQRQDLNPIEEAEAYKRLSESLGLTHAQIATKVGRDRASVSNSLRLLRLPRKVQELVVVGELSMGHARAILGLVNPELSAMLGQKIIRECLSVRRAESLVRSINRGTNTSKNKIEVLSISKNSQPIIGEIEKKLSEMFGTKITLKTQGKGFVLESKFSCVKELNDFLARLMVEI